jgi:hypothetical protein
VRAFWKRNREFSEFETELRARRSEPPAQFVRALAGRVGGERSWVRPKLRVVLVTALVVLATAAVASAGGSKVAASSTSQLAQVVSSLTSSSSNSAKKGEDVSAKKVDNETPADDQYKPGKGCGDQNHVHEREDECKKLK